MFENQPPPPGDSQRTAASTVRPLARRYFMVLSTVAVLVLIDQAILQPQLVQLNFSAPGINLAGRQRMLSQKVSKEALALHLADNSPTLRTRRVELAASLEQWTIAHRALLEGDVDRGARPIDHSAAAVLREIEPAFLLLRGAAREILATGSPAKRGSASAAAVRILNTEPTYLRGMEQVVAMLEASAQQRVAWLRACGLIAMVAIIALLSGVVLFVLRPATRLICDQVHQLADSDARHRQLVEMLSLARDTLELRVSERTGALAAANRALQREMAERQTAELRLLALSAELAHASRVTALGQLATGLAHEINQPLATVANHAGALELALDRPHAGDGEARLLVGQIKQAALRAGTIVRRMRNFVRRGEVQTLPVDLNVLVGEVVELCQIELRHADVRLKIELAPQPVMALVDAVQIQQVLVNLIQNALQAMVRHATPERMLWISTRLTAQDAALEVADAGPGLPAEIRGHSFQPFRSGNREGLGLGLAISRDIVEQHRGHIWSENRDGGGAVVGFSLPRLHTHEIHADQPIHCVCG
jgi:two-component system sensor kinase FixL